MKKRSNLLIITLVLLGLAILFTTFMLVFVIKIGCREYFQELSLALLIAAVVATPAYSIELYTTKRDEKRVRNSLIKRIIICVDKLFSSNTDLCIFIGEREELNDIYTELLKEGELTIAADIFELLAKLNGASEVNALIETEKLKGEYIKCRMTMINYLKK